MLVHHAVADVQLFIRNSGSTFLCAQALETLYCLPNEAFYMESDLPYIMAVLGDGH
jgi:hypothetical protein